jgi:hypothetical protein
MPSDPSSDHLPFEPRQKKKKSPNIPPLPPPMGLKQREEAKKNASLRAIPEAVSRRMLRRMAIFSGIPTVLGMSSFFIFYWIISNEWVKIPTVAVGIVSLSFFGLGVLGLSYGIFSASWEEERVGGWFGWREFQSNLGRTISAFRSARKEAKEN